jgi:hypothetical protein
MTTQQVAVELDRLGPKAGPFLDPDLGVIGQRDAGSQKARCER